MRRTALYRNKDLLQERLRQVPVCPGIYRFYDASGAIVYVGKSVCLRDRVRSYFTGRVVAGKVRRMRQEIVELDWQETGSELEALLLESRLVKHHQPRFNVLLRGFVPLPYVRVDTQDPFPLIQITRAPERDGATYFGPFHSRSALESAVRALTDSLKLRDCDFPGEQLVGQRPCYRYEFGVCSGPCLGEITSDDYRMAVESACDVFAGQEHSVINLLREKMARAAERLQFELAARFRDATRHIESVAGRQQALVSAVRELSLVAVCPAARGPRLCYFVFRCGRLVYQDEGDLGELTDPHARRHRAARLAALAAPTPEDVSRRLDAALLDEVQIVTAWMKQKTREGDYWEFPRNADPAQGADGLEDWLHALATRILTPTEQEAAA